MSYLLSTTPCFSVADISRTMKWYEEFFQFTSDPFPQTEPFQFCILRRDAIAIMLQRVDSYVKSNIYNHRGGGVWDAYILTKGVKELYELVSDRVEIIKPLRHQPYGRWEFEVRDINGYVLVFSE